MKALTRSRRSAMFAVLAAFAGLLTLAPSASATYPGANGKIAFLTQSADILSINSDGTGVTNLTPGPGTNRVFRWSPDGTKLAFISDGDGLDNQYDIYKINADGGGLVKLSTPRCVRYFDWSPQSSKIVFSTCSPWALWTVNADGSSETQLAGGEPVYFPTYDAPVWSPDGRKIAFERNLDGVNSEIYTINADGSDATRLTNTTSIERGPVWSPDSKRIAFTTTRETPCDLSNPGCVAIHVMNADGSTRTPLTDDTASNAQPEWSPDGSKIPPSACAIARLRGIST
jgi:Tol biopolymer transport system component